MKSRVTIAFVMLNFSISAQIKDSIPKDSIVPVNAFQFHMGFDWYYTHNQKVQETSILPYFVSFGHNREIQQNLIYADLKWDKRRYRVHAVPAIGTFMDQNSASEKGIFKNLLEANVGFKLWKKRNIWLDAGVLGSPYTNENPYSQEHLTLTRTLAAEYVPYYLAGARASWQIDERWKVCVLLLNGWQQIHDINGQKSLGTQVEFKLNERDLLNWNTYIGKEGISGEANYGMRYFSDVFWTHGFSENISVASCAYAGIQNNSDKTNDFWWQANTAIRYSTKKFGSVSLRGEYFSDVNNAVIPSQILDNGFKCVAFSVGYGYRLLSTMLVRLEYRRLQSTHGSLYVNQKFNTYNQLDLLTAALTFWF